MYFSSLDTECHKKQRKERERKLQRRMVEVGRTAQVENVTIEMLPLQVDELNET